MSELETIDFNKKSKYNRDIYLNQFEKRQSYYKSYYQNKKEKYKKEIYENNKDKIKTVNRFKSENNNMIDMSFL